jgi:hypothetical protein
MNTRHLNQYLSVGVLMAALCLAPLAMAATESSSGDTSGPAAGTRTTPGAAAQKQPSGSTHDAAAGAPGVEAKPGVEGGSKPGGATSTGQSKPR